MTSVTAQYAAPNGTGIRRDADEAAEAESEPPPAYSAHDTQSTTLEANFARPYEIQDSGMFSQPSGASPSHIQQQHQQHTGSSIPSSSSSSSSQWQHPAGPPPSQQQQSLPSSSSQHLNPPLPPRHPSQTPRPPPAPHVDGVSTFNRPPLPNQQPAHLETAARAARYAPSANPQSGQPLLHKGRILIYPPAFSCPKCHNTGYKAYDPSNPHQKCWDKYGKQFTSAVWNAPNFTFDNASLQRPLPNMRYTSSSGPPLQPQQPLPPGPPPQHHPGYYQAGQAGPPPPQMTRPQQYQQPPPPPPVMQQQYHSL